jgi:hypothetical protein
MDKQKLEKQVHAISLVEIQLNVSKKMDNLFLLAQLLKIELRQSEIKASLKQ